MYINTAIVKWYLHIYNYNVYNKQKGHLQELSKDKFGLKRTITFSVDD